MSHEKLHERENAVDIRWCGLWTTGQPEDIVTTPSAAQQQRSSPVLHQKIESRKATSQTKSGTAAATSQKLMWLEA